MRRPLSALLSVALVPAAVVVPVLSAPASTPHPVAPHVITMAVNDTVARGLSAESRTPAFSAFGGSWDGGASGTVQVRVRAADSQTWSEWTSLAAADVGPDPGSADARSAGRRVASEVVWAGPSDGVQTRVVGGSAPANLKLELVDPGTSPADATVGATTIGGSSAEAATGMPQIYTRAQWGADESIRLKQCPGGPTYSSTIKIGFVHHTVSSNNYSAAQVPAMIRSFYAFHVQGNGWCDIGYNFLVDRFGRIWEGRYGGIDKAVIGAHTGGFNRDSFGVSMIGDFSSLTPNSSIQQAISRLMAWKLGRYYRNPLGKATLTYAGGNYRFCGSQECPVGSSVSLNVISGHRDADVGHTACPGNAGEATLPAVRTATVAAMGAGLVSPSVSTTVHRLGDGGAFTVTAGAVSHQSWTLTATGAAGNVVRTITGTVSQGRQITAAWGGTTDAGTPAAAGSYTLRLTSQGATGSAVPYAVPVVLRAPVELAGPAQVGYGAPVALTGSTYPGATVTMLQAPQGSTGFVPVATVVAGSGGGFSWSYPGTSAHQTYAQVGSNLSAVVTTVIGPSVTGPAVAVPGSVVTLTGTAPPGSTVQVFRQRPPAAAFLSATVVAGTDGGWTTTFVADAGYSWYAVANGLQSPVGVTSITAPPTLTGPDHVTLHAPVTLKGTAPAGQQVQIWRRQRGHASYTLAASVVAGPAGTFTWAYRGDDDFRWYATTPGGKSGVGLTQVGVSAHGPAKVDKGATASLVGTALPGAPVEIWRAPIGSNTFAKAAVVTARTDGSWSWSFIVDASRRWYATSRGWRSAGGATLVASPPLVSGPASTTYDATVHITGLATPGDTVTLWLHRRGSTGYRGEANAVAKADGSWSMPFVADEDYRWYVTSISGRSKAGVTTIRPAIAAVPSAKRGSRVTIHGFAVPGQVVHVWFKAAGRWTLGRALRTNAAGRWGSAFTLTRTVSWYAESRGVRSGIGTTRPV
ncbi:MAG: hypothetical protein QOJ83_3281 [Frankiales bacterium]|nr:hypothetical protein [Frankiales bacterium]